MIPKHIQEQIEKEAAAKYSHMSMRIGYRSGAESYASKLLSAEELIEKMAGHIKSGLRDLNILSDGREYIVRALTEYNTYKKHKDGSGGCIYIGNPAGYCNDCGFPIPECNCTDKNIDHE